MAQGKKWYALAGTIIHARHLSADDRKALNVPATAAPDAVGIFHPETGELLNTMGAEQFAHHYHALDVPSDGAAEDDADGPASATDPHAARLEAIEGRLGAVEGLQASAQAASSDPNDKAPAPQAPAPTAQA